MTITLSIATCFKHSIQTNKDNRPVNIFYVAGHTVISFRQKKRRTSQISPQDAP